MFKASKKHNINIIIIVFQDHFCDRNCPRNVSFFKLNPEAIIFGSNIKLPAPMLVPLPHENKKKFSGQICPITLSSKLLALSAFTNFFIKNDKDICF